MNKETREQIEKTAAKIRDLEHDDVADELGEIIEDETSTHKALERLNEIVEVGGAFDYNHIGTANGRPLVELYTNDE